MKDTNRKKNIPDPDIQITSIPYVKGLFEKLKHIVKNKITLVAKSDNNLRKTVFSRLKDQTPLMKQSSLVYEVTCECEEKYVGQTVQHLEERLKQHNDGKPIDGSNPRNRRKVSYSVDKEQNPSALTSHIRATKHKPKWLDTKIICKEKNHKKRDVLEMIAIKQRNNCMNKQTDSIMLSTTYNNLILNIN